MSRVQRAIRQIMAICLLLVISTSVHAFSVKEEAYHLDEMAARSERILGVTCLDRRMTWLDEAGQESAKGRPATAYTLRVDKVYRGEGVASGDVIEVFQPGHAAPVPGQRYRMPLLGAGYEVDQSYVAFLSSRSAWGYTAAGAFGLGLFRIYERDGASYVKNMVGNHHLVSTKTLANAKVSRKAETALKTLAERGSGPLDLNTFDAAVSVLSAR